MARATIRVREDESETPDPSGQVSMSVISESDCALVMRVRVRTVTTCWVEAIQSGSSPFLVTINNETSPGQINGYTLNNGQHVFNVTIEGYVSPQQSLNDLYTFASFTLRDAQGGNIIANKLYGKYHTNNIF